MKKNLLYFFLIFALVDTLAVSSISAKESKVLHFGKKALRIGWHGGEIFAGCLITQVFYRRELYKNLKRDTFVYGIGAVSLLFHGLYGLNDELELGKNLNNFIVKGVAKAAKK